MKFRVTGALALAAASILIGGGTSYAADGGVYTVGSGGWAGWTESGDTLQVCDISSDGYGVRGYIYTPNSSSDPGNGTVLIKGNDPSNDGDCATFAKDLSESIHISIKVCQYAGDVVTACRYGTLR
ncbi:hypothetical protein ACIPC1_34755 [Streptomyces sp. NPDC087263]|uniref:hypothetical protein n=1 Tax=Streptomyces sp. NPDC087263 TaxID=3365773 RepID=UPI00381CA901